MGQVNEVKGYDKSKANFIGHKVVENAKMKVARCKLIVALYKPFSESIFEYQVKLPIGS